MKIKDSVFKEYRRTNIAELTPYVEGLELDGVSISKEDKEAGSPVLGDMIGRNPENHEDMWLIAKTYFKNNFAPKDDGKISGGPVFFDGKTHVGAGRTP